MQYNTLLFTWKYNVFHLTSTIFNVILILEGESIHPKLIGESKRPKKRRIIEMALTRSMLKGMGLTDEQVGAIIEEHVSTVDGLKAERDKYKAQAEKLPEVEKKLQELESSTGDWEGKYKTEHEAFEKYKTEIEGKEKSERLKDAYKKLLGEAKIGEKHIASILRVTDFSGMKLDKDGNLVDADKLIESIKSEWSDFVTSSSTKGAGVETPPAGGGSTKTKEEIMAIKDTSERQQAMKDNPELFGLA